MSCISVNTEEVVVDQIRNSISSMVNYLDSGNVEKASEYITDDVVFVRPTGNPLTKTQWIAMFNSDDVTLLSNKMVDFYKVDVSPSNDWALVCYSTHAKFTYKGVENDDISVFSVLMKRVNNKWLLSHLQRSTGRLPTDSMPVFN